MKSDLQNPGEHCRTAPIPHGFGKPGFAGSEQLPPLHSLLSSLQLLLKRQYRLQVHLCTQHLFLSTRSLDSGTQLNLASAQ